MPLAVNFLIVQKDAVLGSRAHEVIVACTGSEAATHCGTRLLAELTSLQKQKKRLEINPFNPFYTQATITVVSCFFRPRQKLRAMPDLPLHCCHVSLLWLTRASETWRRWEEEGSLTQNYFCICRLVPPGLRLSCLYSISKRCICKLHQLVSQLFLQHRVFLPHVGSLLLRAILLHCFCCFNNA